MKPRHQVSRTAIELIKRFEGYRRKAAQLPDGRWTIGYGHTLTARQGTEVSEQDAEALLLYDLIAVAHVVNETTFTALTQNQFDALCAFAFNVGLDNFRRSSVLKRVNEGAYIQAAFNMELWRKAEFEGERIVIDGLVRRRAAEKYLFLTPPGEAFAPAPSPLLKPVLDIDSPNLAPRQTPTAVIASLSGEQVTAHREGEPIEEPTATPDEDSPFRTAAEQVTARLQTIFPEPGDAAFDLKPTADEPEAPSEAAVPTEAEPVAAPLDEIVGDAGPAAPAEEPAAPAQDDIVGDEGPAETPVAIFEPVVEAPVEEPAAEPVVEEAPEREPMQPPANDLIQPDRAAETASAEAAPQPERRIIIDDTAPYEFVPAPVRPLDEPKDSLLGLVFLAILGLAFFGGGIFWALNARPGVATGPFTPLMVGWLAGVAGVGFFVVAVFLLLQRMGRAAERRRPEKPRY